LRDEGGGRPASLCPFIGGEDVLEEVLDRDDPLPTDEGSLPLSAPVILPFVNVSSAIPLTTPLDANEEDAGNPFEGRLGPAELEEEAGSNAKCGGGALPSQDRFISTTNADTG
jgi:hypothetical protein